MEGLKATWPGKLVFGLTVRWAKYPEPIFVRWTVNNYSAITQNIIVDTMHQPPRATVVQCFDDMQAWANNPFFEIVNKVAKHMKLTPAGGRIKFHRWEPDQLYFWVKDSKEYQKTRWKMVHVQSEILEKAIHGTI